MIQNTFYPTIVMALLAGCSGPVQTRVQTVSNSAQTDDVGYSFAADTKQPSKIHAVTKKILIVALKEKGFEHQEKGILIVDFAAANRPASIAVGIGDGQKQTVIAKSKTQKLLQSCEDDEHRLIVTVFHRDSGDLFYRGTASEHHCKTKLMASIPHLIKAALSSLGDSGSGEIRQKILNRWGAE